VLRPDSDFFRYFGDPSGKNLLDGATAVPAPAAANPAHPANATK
jgi:hypothetical protein